MRKTLNIKTFLMCQILFVTLSVAGPLTGDVELLKLVANGYKANLESVKTLTGSANINVEVNKGGNRTYISNAEASFIASQELDAVRWKWKNIPKDGEINTFQQIATGMLKDKRTYRFKIQPPNPDGSRKQHVLDVRPEILDDRGVGIDDEAFNPYFFYTAREADWHRRLLWYYENANNPKLVGGSVVRKGNYVIFKTGNDDHFNQYTFDLEKGCNLVNHQAKDPVVETSWTIDFQEKDGVYVPEAISSKKTVGNGTKIRTTTKEVSFSSLEVNKHVSEDEFHIKRLGVKPGDVISDMEIKLSYVYKGFAEETETDMLEELAGKTPDDAAESELVTSLDEIEVKKPAHGIASSENTEKSQSSSNDMEHETYDKKIYAIILISLVVLIVVVILLIFRKKIG